MVAPVSLMAHGLRMSTALLIQQCVWADVPSWTNPGGGSWGLGENWQGGSIPPDGSVDAGFHTMDVTRDTVITLDGDRTAGGLIFGDNSPSHDWFLRSGSGGSLTLNAGAGVPSIHVANQTATLGVALAGNQGLRKTGAGTLVLTGSGNYSGPTLVEGGVLRLGAPPLFPAGMKLLPLGDSITFGFNGANAGYRGPLHDLLVPAAPDFRYVGTSVLRPGSLPPEQRSHEGHSSYNLQDVSNNLDGFDNTRFLQYGGAERNPNGGYWLTGGNGTGREPITPDVITMMLGTNDLDIPQNVEIRLRELITKIIKLCPDARLIVAKITPIPIHSGVDAYNQIVEQVVEDFIADGNRVHLVDLNTGFPSDGLDLDQVHPNNKGFQWMALQWHDAIIRACSASVGVNESIPATSPVSISRNATLELAGNQAATGAIALGGDLGLHGGVLTTPGLMIAGSGRIEGSGSIHGPVIHNGGSIGAPGQNLAFSGVFTNNGTVSPQATASLTFGGGLVNNGIFNPAKASSVVLGGNVTNNGNFRVGSGSLAGFAGTFVNNGLMDFSAGFEDMPENLVNHGLVIDSSEVKTHSTSFTDTTITIAIDSRYGSDYQLQHSPDLGGGSWMDVGPSQAGVTGQILTFTATKEPNGAGGFYRIKVSR
jgi:autotransporter-associated beta strand protein